MTDDDVFDRDLEEAVSADDAMVERVATAALAAGPARHFPAGRLAAAAALVAVLVAAVVVSWPAAPDEPGVIRMRNVGDVILVDYPDGSRAIIGPAKTDHVLFAGFDYVMIQGEPQ